MSGSREKPNDREETMITPGGPRPKDQIHRVGPEEAVRRDETGTYAVVPKGSTFSSERIFAMSDDFVLTPGGIRHKSLVRRIQPGNVIDGSQGRLRKVHALSGKVVADFGLLAKRSGGGPLMPGNVAHPHALSPALGSGWIVYASWTNNTGSPVSLFKTAWLVPPPPATKASQTIFLFNGIQNSTMIYQPVLQWGVSAAGGGDYWAVASWYVDGQGGPAHMSNLTQVNPGDVLIGVMTLTGQSGSSFSYNCQFQGIPNSTLAVQDIDELTWCIETLEAYGIAQCSDYPAIDKTSMTSIEIQTASGEAGLNWAPASPVTDCGQHVVVVSNASPNGEVDLFYRS